MPKLFLASSLDQTISELKVRLSSLNVGKKVLFVEDAALPYVGQMDLYWVENDYTAFIQNGFEVTRFFMSSMQTKTETEITNYLLEFDIIHFNGGHTKYLLACVHKFGFFNPVLALVNSDQLVFTGTSAGPMIAAPTLDKVGRLDDDLEFEFSQFLKPEYLIGFGFSNFLIMPHFNNTDFIPSNIEAIKSIDYPYPIIFLHDNEAIWQVDSNLEMIVL
jgi:peptidase E